MAHGGDRYSNRIRLDFSVNINPLGMPPKVEKSLKEGWKYAQYYPDLQARKLVDGISRFLKIKQEHLIPGNGASELLMASVHAIQPKKALLPVPSFTGYEHVLNAVGCEIIRYKMTKENEFLPDEAFLSAITDEIDILFLTNPNNPTGRYIPATLLEEILDCCSKKQVWVVLDECFMELSDDPKGRSQIWKVEQRPNLLLVRAFTKSFAIPGIRLGYAISSNQVLIGKIRARLPEWNLSVLAQEAGCAALCQLQWLEKARSVILHERHRLERGLRELGFADFASSAGFILFWDEKKRGIDWYAELLKKGTLIRDCSDYAGLEKGYYRIAVRVAEENQELLRQIREILEQYQS